MACTLGVDVGTYGSKGVILDARGRIRAQAETEHGMSIPRPGWAEQDAEAVWWGDLCTLSRELLRQSGVAPTQLGAVCVSALGPCVLAVDKQGNPLRPAILYGIDTRATAEIRALTRTLGAGWIRRTCGSDLSTQSAGPKILWLRRNEPGVWERTWKIMGSTTFLVYRLTGKVFLDHYTASFFQPLYGLGSRSWQDRALGAVCPPELLPDLQWSASIAGALTNRAAEQTGLAPGTPVLVGTTDAGAEAASAGVLESGDTMLMYGSTLFVIQVCSRRPQGGVFWPAVYLFPDSFALAGGMATTGALTRWFRDEFGAREKEEQRGGGTNAYARLADEAAGIPPGAQGLLALPFFSGERTPINDPYARGVVAGLTLSHTRAHLYRSLLEGVAFGIRHNLEGVEQAGGPSRRLVAVGGGVQNRLWMQISSDVLGRDLLLQRSPGACYGDAALASAATGGLEDVRGIRDWIGEGEIVRANPSHYRLYTRMYELYQALYRDTRRTVHALAELGGT